MSDVETPSGEPEDGADTPVVETDSQPLDRRRLPLVVGLVAIVLAVGLVLTYLSRSDLESELDRRDDIASVAGEFSATLLSYDFEDIDATVDDVDPLVTDVLREELATGYQGDLRAQIEQLEAVSTADVLDVLVSDTVGDTARAIVVVETDVKSEVSQARVTTYLDLALLRVDGEWLVNELKALRTEGGLVDDDGNPVPTTSGEPAPEADDEPSPTSTPAATTPTSASDGE